MSLKSIIGIIAVLVIGMYAGAALFGDDNNTESGENNSIFQDIEETVSSTASAVTSTYEPYTVEVVEIKDDRLNIWYKDEIYPGIDVKITITNNDETTDVLITDIAIVNEDGTYTNMEQGVESNFLDVGYYKGGVSGDGFFTLYTGSKKNLHLPFRNIDSTNNPKLVLTLISDAKDKDSRSEQEYIIPISSYFN